MILRVEMISVVSHARKNMILYGKNSTLMKNNNFDNVFAIEVFLTIVFYQFFKNDWIFINVFFFFI